jgi:hypothetical protein
MVSLAGYFSASLSKAGTAGETANDRGKIFLRLERGCNGYRLVFFSSIAF